MNKHLKWMKLEQLLLRVCTKGVILLFIVGISLQELTSSVLKGIQVCITTLEIPEISFQREYCNMNNTQLISTDNKMKKPRLLQWEKACNNRSFVETMRNKLQSFNSMVACNA